ncbi:MAG: ZIP family metal transporter [Candidatus Lokiarchaeota archaeon]
MGSIGSILTASIFLLFKERIRKLLIPCLISYSSGTLLAAAFLGMIPNAQSESDPKMILSIVLIGIVGFFLMEKMMIWRHCHKENCETHSKAGPIILIGDAFHNSIDGAVIASSFLISIPIGIAVSISVIAHEIPQEVGDFAILLEEKYSKAKAFFQSCTRKLGFT